MGVVERPRKGRRVKYKNFGKSGHWADMKQGFLRGVYP